MEYKEIIFKSMKKFKVLACRFLGNKTFPLKIPRMKAIGASMRKFKQVCSTHLAMMECILSTELMMILDVRTKAGIRVKDKNVGYKTVNMTI